MAKRTLLLVILCAAPCLAQKEPIRLPLPLAAQEQYLHSLVHQPTQDMHGKNWTTIRPFVLGGSSVRTSSANICSSGGEATGSGVTTGSPSWSWSGSTICRELSRYRDWAVLALPDPQAPREGYLIFAECDVRHIWNHCEMQRYGQTGSMILGEKGKPGRWSFDISVGTVERLGQKPRVSKFHVTEVWHMRAAP